MTPEESSTFFQNSKFYPLLESCGDQICAWAPDAWRPDPLAKRAHEKALEKARQEATLKLAQLTTRQETKA